MPEIIVMGRQKLLLLCFLILDIDKIWHISSYYLLLEAALDVDDKFSWACG